MADQERCSHQLAYPENVEWPADVALDHFLHCLTEEQRLERWKAIRKTVRMGQNCVMQDHAGGIESQRRCILKLLTGVRELLERVEQPPALAIGAVRDRLREVLGLD